MSEPYTVREAFCQGRFCEAGHPYERAMSLISDADAEFDNWLGVRDAAAAADHNDIELLTTQAELDALVPGTIILDDEGHAWHKHRNDPRWQSDDNGMMDSPLFWKPFRVLHTPPPLKLVEEAVTE